MLAHQERHGFCYWAVMEKESRRLIGSCGMAHPLDGGPDIDFGYTLSRSHWGLGLATEAAAACVAYAFEQLHLMELCASVDSRNAASRRVLEKIGFRYQRTEQVETGVDLRYVARPVCNGSEK
jgi:ribosomal-protein-alanine N-acetyltransferase